MAYVLRNENMNAEVPLWQGSSAKVSERIPSGGWWLATKHAVTATCQTNVNRKICYLPRVYREHDRELDKTCQSWWLLPISGDSQRDKWHCKKGIHEALAGLWSPGQENSDLRGTGRIFIPASDLKRFPEDMNSKDVYKKTSENIQVLEDTIY